MTPRKIFTSFAFIFNFLSASFARDYDIKFTRDYSEGEKISDWVRLRLDKKNAKLEYQVILPVLKNKITFTDIKLRALPSNQLPPQGDITQLMAHFMKNKEKLTTYGLWRDGDNCLGNEDFPGGNPKVKINGEKYIQLFISATNKLNKKQKFFLGVSTFSIEDLIEDKNETCLFFNISDFKTYVSVDQKKIYIVPTIYGYRESYSYPRWITPIGNFVRAYIVVDNEPVNPDVCIISARGEFLQRDKIEEKFLMSKTLIIAKNAEFENFLKRMYVSQNDLQYGYFAVCSEEIMDLIINKVYYLKYVLDLRLINKAFQDITHRLVTTLELCNVNEDHTDEALAKIAETFPNIKVLNVSWSSRIPRSALLKLGQAMPNLRIIKK